MVTAIVVNLVDGVVATGVAVKINYRGLSDNMHESKKLIEFYKLFIASTHFQHFI